MLLAKIGILSLMLLVMPLGIGAGVSAFIEKYKKNIVFCWIAGFLTEWGFFQVIAVPAIIKGMSFGRFTVIYVTGMALFALLGSGLWIMKQKKAPGLSVVSGEAMSRTEKILWVIAGLGILFQLIMNFVLAFEDGDDAFYVTNSNLAVTYDSMYRLLPYTFGTTVLDYRHCLAPFPIWIACLAKVSGMHPTIVSHSVIPLVMISLTYGIYGLIGCRLLEGKKKYRPLFLIFAELVVLWGNYSVYTAETFLISRSRQGKALLCSLVVPAIFLLVHMIGEKLLAGKRVEKAVWFLVIMAVLTAGLGSTMGNFIVGLQLGVFGICLFFTTRKWKNLIPVVISLIPAVVLMLMYVVLR